MYNISIVIILIVTLLLRIQPNSQSVVLLSFITSKFVLENYTFSFIISPGIAVAYINLFSELMNSGVGSLATASDPCKGKKMERLTCRL